MNQIRLEFNQLVEKAKSPKGPYPFSSLKTPTTIGVSGTLFMSKLFTEIHLNPYVGLSTNQLDKYLKELAQAFK